MGRELSKEEYLSLWAEEAASFAESGLSQQAWCDQNGISVNTFRYHLRALREAEEGNKLSFVKVSPEAFSKPKEASKDAPESSSITPITVDVNGIKIELADCSREKLKVVLEAVLSCLTI